MPLFRTDTGCRCRKTLVSITTTRLRRSRGAGWRKMLFQTCEPRRKSPTDITWSFVSRQSSVVSRQWFFATDNGPLTTDKLHLDERLRVVPLPEFLLELLALIDDELAVVADADAPALQRPGGRALEVDAGDLEAGAVAGALELLFALQPVRRAAEVRAGRAQGVDRPLVAHDPGVLVLVALHHLAFLVLVGRAHLEPAGRLGQHVGEEEADRPQEHADERGGHGHPGDGEPAAEQRGQEEAPALGPRLGRGGGLGR